MDDTHTILLAAGLSRRMGAQNKLLLPINGQPMVRHMAQTYLQATCGPVTVVTGHDTGAVMAALDGLPVHITFNPDFADQGQSSSVLAGLSATSDAEVTIIALADQPLLNACDITEFLQAHHAGDSSRISIPVSGDMRGNPVLVPQALKRRLIDDPRNPGCRRFIQANPDLVQKITVTSAGFFTDMDTPDAYDAILSHLKEPAL